MQAKKENCQYFSENKLVPPIRGIIVSSSAHHVEHICNHGAVFMTSYTSISFKMLI
jgi:histidinol dehydrogenase